MHYIVSDIHGCFYTLQKLLDQVYAKDSDPQLIFIGDYVDRGLHSKNVVEFMIQLQKNGAVCLRGNHDDIVDWILNRQCKTDLKEMIPASMETNLLNIGTWWLSNGLFDTISNYVVPPKGSSVLDILELFVKSVPEEHKNFFKRLSLFWENDTHFACHGYLDPQKELPRTLTFLPSSSTLDLLWSRFPGSKKGLSLISWPVWDKIGVFGHTTVNLYGASVPIKYGNLRLIDTGAFLGEYMTAYCVEQDGHILQATDGRDVK